MFIRNRRKNSREKKTRPPFLGASVGRWLLCRYFARHSFPSSGADALSQALQKPRLEAENNTNIHWEWQSAVESSRHSSSHLFQQNEVVKKCCCSPDRTAFLGEGERSYRTALYNYVIFILYETYVHVWIFMKYFLNVIFILYETPLFCFSTA